MAIAPRNIEELFAAASRRDRAELHAWLDLFSRPDERYAALRALAEALAGQPGGPARELASWANAQLYQSLGLCGS
jgi:hypothetical protein